MEENNNKIKFNNIKKEEDNLKAIIKEQFGLKLKKIKENDGDYNQKDEIKENENLKLIKKQLNDKLENLQNEKVKIENEYKSKITILKNNLEEKKRPKIEMQNKIKEEEKRKIELEEKKRREIEEKQKKELQLQREREKRKRELELQQEKEEQERELQKKLEEEKRRKELEKIKNNELDKIIKKNVKNSFNLLREDNQQNEYLDEKAIINAYKKEENEFNPLAEEENFRIKRAGTIPTNSSKIVYSYECPNSFNLQQIIYLGTETAEIPVVLKNTCKFTWPLNKTKLVFDRNSKIKGKDVVVKPLANNEEQEVIVIIEGLSKFGEGSYDANVWFNINGENIGKMLILRVVIKKKEEDPMKKYIEKIEQFRKEFNLDEKDYPNNMIYESLTENNFSFEDTFMKLVGLT